jgi:TonB family protein
MATAEDWTKWESQIVNGAFPLLQFLGKSNHSVVFLTEVECAASAAIKLVPADPLHTETQLAKWRAAATLSHPHLIRLFDVGSCQLGGYPFLFFVMEYAEQTLAQILPHRPLTADELREMLLPTLDALAFLHRNNFAHCQLKPPNFLVVNDQLKLASDTICPGGESVSGIAGNDSSSAAGDIWALGIVITEALTQSPPVWPDERSETVALPATLSPEFAGIVQRCLSRNPDNRPTIFELQRQLNPTPSATAMSVPPPVMREAEIRETPIREAHERHLPLGALALALLALVAVWAALHFFRSHPDSPQPAATAAPIASQPAAPPAVASQNSPTPVREQPAQPATDVPSSIVHQEIPNVPLSARESIRGHVKVTVRVTVNRSGEVVHEAVEDPGSSRYFARLATEAARKWRFAPADNQESREWLVRFEFARDGTTGHAAGPRS